MFEEEEKKKQPELNKPNLCLKKYYVYVKDPKTGNIKKVTWGDTTGLKVKLDNKTHERVLPSCHKCDQQNDKTTASYLHVDYHTMQNS